MYVPNDMVEQYYTMHPETEDVLRGEHLREGMVVLIENPSYRQDFGHNLYTTDVFHARVQNRWCTVTRLKIDEEQGQIWFVGVYGDDSKASRNYSFNTAWLVKLDSIPADENVDEEADTSQTYEDYLKAKKTNEKHQRQPYLGPIANSFIRD